MTIGSNNVISYLVRYFKSVSVQNSNCATIFTLDDLIPLKFYDFLPFSKHNACIPRILGRFIACLIIVKAFISLNYFA